MLFVVDSKNPLLNAVGNRITLGSGRGGGSAKVTAVGTSGVSVVVWLEIIATYNGSSIHIQRFDANEQAVGESKVLNAQTDTAGSYSTAHQVTAVGNTGAFAVTWRGSGLQSDSIYVRLFGTDE